jgi:hypothetical protein
MELEEAGASIRYPIRDRDGEFCALFDEILADAGIQIVLSEFETHYNPHRPHQSLDQSAPLHPMPEPITRSADVVDLNVRRRDRLGGILHEYEHAS